MVRCCSSIILLLLILSSATWNLWWGFPFQPVDVLPFLPWRVSRSVLGRFWNPADLVPTFIGHVAASPNASLEWRGACFRKNVAWVELHNYSASAFGGGKLHIKTFKPRRWTCLDLYIFATPYRLTWHFFFLSGHHTVDIREWEGEAEFQYIKRHGVSIFAMDSGMMGSLRALREVFALFSKSERGENRNIDFLKQRMGATFERRPGPWATKVNPVDLQSGDLLVLSKLRGPWGGFETLEKWVTGSFAGHSVVCLRDAGGKLWIAESGHEVSEGPDVIAIVPWEDWWEMEVKRDTSDPHIALLPLHPEIRANFNEAAAWKYARSMEGKPYGYHNMIFSWIDTADANFPLPLDSHLVASFMSVWNRLQPEYAPLFWDEALNKRLDTKGLTFPEIIVEADRRGISFGELLAVPERDEWVYSEGQSVSCIAFVLGIYRAAGLFDSLSSSIHVTEFTIKDAYSLKFFEDNSSRVPGWCETGALEGEGIFCQLLGKYRMKLPDYNTLLPYPHMNERCPSLPPDYSRSQSC